MGQKGKLGIAVHRASLAKVLASLTDLTHRPRIHDISLRVTAFWSPFQPNMESFAAKNFEKLVTTCPTRACIPLRN